jgi:flagellar protein FliS
MWKDRYLENRVLTASPLELVVILYEHTIICVQDARTHLSARDIPSRTTAICKAINLIGELRASLNHEVGGEISANLEKLYKYMQSRLTEANMKQLDQPLAEVESLLQNLLEGWTGISQAQQTEMPGMEQADAAAEADCNWNVAFAQPTEYGASSISWSA